MLLVDAAAEAEEVIGAADDGYRDGGVDEDVDPGGRGVGGDQGDHGGDLEDRLRLAEPGGGDDEAALGVPIPQAEGVRVMPAEVNDGVTAEQRRRVGDFCVWDEGKKAVAFISRDEVGKNLKVPAALEGVFQVKLANGQTVEVMTVLAMYKRHLRDYDPETAEEISGAPADLIRRLAEDIWKTTEAGHPVAIHIGEKASSLA